MTDFSYAQWIVAALAFAAFAVLAQWVIRTALRGRLMRCPNTGGVGFVEVGPAKAENGEAAGVRVRHCDLWPEKQGCGEECLERYSETSPGHQVRLEALRPFDRP